MSKIKLVIALVAFCSLAWAAPAEQKSATPAPAEVEEEGAPGEINWFDGLLGTPSNPKFKGQPPLGALLLNFGVLVFVYYRFGKKPLQDALKQRRDSIAKEIENAAKILGEAKARAVRYQEQLGKKDEDAEAARAGLVQAGQVEKERIRKDADEKAARLRRDAAFLIDQEVKQRKQDLVRETVEKAIADAEALLARAVTQADQERLADEYLASLGAP